MELRMICPRSVDARDQRDPRQDLIVSNHSKAHVRSGNFQRIQVNGIHYLEPTPS